MRSAFIRVGVVAAVLLAMARLGSAQCSGYTVTGSNPTVQIFKPANENQACHYDINHGVSGNPTLVFYISAWQGMGNSDRVYFEGTQGDIYVVEYEFTGGAGSFPNTPGSGTPFTIHIEAPDIDTTLTFGYTVLRTSEISSVSPNRIGVGASIDLDMDGIDLVSNHQESNPGFAVVGFVESGDSCDSANIMGLASYKEPSPSPMSGGLPADSMAGSTIYDLCLSKDGGNYFVLQTTPTLEVVHGDQDSITGHDLGGLATITTFDNPQVVNLAGIDAVKSATTVVGFALAAWNCDITIGDTPYPVSKVDGQLADTIAFPGTYDICLSMDGGLNFARQVGAGTFEVYDATPVSLASLSPTTIGHFSTPDLVLPVNAPITSRSRIGFVPQGSPCSGGPRAVTTLDATTVELAASIDTPGLYETCLSINGGIDWVKQILPQTVLEVVSADGNSVATMTPRSFGIEASPPFTLGGAEITPFTRFAFTTSPSDCGTRLAVTDYLADGTPAVAGGAFDAPATFTLCYTVAEDDAHWFRQDGQTITIRGYSLTDVSPDPVGHTVAVDDAVLTGAQTTSTVTRVGFSAADPSCATAVEADVVYDGAATQTLGPFSPASTTVYTVCYSMDDGASYRPAGGSLTVVVEERSDLSSPVSPSSFDSGAAISMTFPGLVITPSTAVALVSDPVNCNGIASTTAASTTPNVVINPVATPGTYYVCVSQSGGATWAHQDNAGSVTVVLAPSTTSITGLDPGIVGSGLATEVAVTAGSASPSPAGRVAWAIPALCNNPSFRYGEMPFTSMDAVSVTFTFASAVAAVTDLAVCYSTNDGASYTEQTLRMPVVSPTPTALTVASNTVLNGTTAFNVTFSTPDPRLATFPDQGVRFVAAGQDCGNPSGGVLFEASSFGLDGATPLLVTYAPGLAGDWDTCWTYDYSGGSVAWVRQPGAAITRIFSVESRYIEALSPAVFAAGQAAVVTLSLEATFGPGPESFFGFVLSSLASDAACADGGTRIVTTPYPTEVPTALGGSGIVAAGSYDLCFQATSAAGWYAQASTAVRGIRVVSASVDSIAAIAPLAITATAAPTNLTLIPTGGETLATPTAYAALVNDSEPDCANRFAVGRLSSVHGAPAGAMSWTTSGPLALGTYATCLTVDNTTWVKQDTPSTVFRVIVASATSVIRTEPANIAAGVTTAVTFVGAAASATSQIALTQATDCVSPTLALPLPDTPSLDIPAAALTPGVWNICFTTDGVTWFPQTLAVLTVVTATFDSVSAISPPVVAVGTASPVVASGAVATTKSGLRLRPLVLGGGCDLSAVTVSAAIDDDTGAVTLPPIALAGEYSVCYSVDGINFVLQNDTVVTVVDCGSREGCGNCIGTPDNDGFCDWCVEDAACALGGTCASAPVLAGGTSDQCFAIDLDGIEQLSGDVSGGTTVTLPSDYVVSAGDYTCSWGFPTGPVSSPAVRAADGSSVSCASVPSDALRGNYAFVSVNYRGVPFVTNAAVFLYYDCAAYAGGSIAADTCDVGCSALGGECGWCLGDGACSIASDCAGPGLLWAGDACPTVDAVEPSEVNIDDAEAVGGTVTVSGSLLAGDLECDFGSGRLTAAVVVSESVVECPLPSGLGEADSGAVELGLVLAASGDAYTTDTVVFTFVTDAEIALQGETPGVNAGLLAALLAVLAILLVLCLVGLIWKRGKAKEEARLRPPVLNTADQQALVYGQPVALLSGEAASALGPMELQPIVGSAWILRALNDSIPGTDVDRCGKAVYAVLSDMGGVLPLMLSLIQHSVAICESRPTLFRTNSLATRLWSLHARVVGITYARAVVGPEVNRIINDTNKSDIVVNQNDLASNENKFRISQITQSFLGAIFKSVDDIPEDFFVVFETMVAAIDERFPIDPASLATSMAAAMHESVVANDHSFALLNEAQAAFQGEWAAVEDAANDGGRARMVDGLGGVSESVRGLQAAVAALADETAAIADQMEKLEGALDPSSAAAARLMAEHRKEQMAVSVGGFFFLRFIVPLITAPEILRLVHEPPAPESRKMLVLVAKMVQNVSNRRLFGVKEDRYAPLNDVLASNMAHAETFLDTLASNRHHGAAYEPVEVPLGHRDAAYGVVGEYLVGTSDRMLEHLHAYHDPAAEEAAAALVDFVKQARAGGVINPEGSSAADVFGQ